MRELDEFVQWADAVTNIRITENQTKTVDYRDRESIKGDSRIAQARRLAPDVDIDTALTRFNDQELERQNKKIDILTATNKVLDKEVDDLEIEVQQLETEADENEDQIQRLAQVNARNQEAVAQAIDVNAQQQQQLNQLRRLLPIK